MTQEEILREAMRAQNVLTSYAFAILRDWSLAQDAFQEALIAVAKKWETFDPGGNLVGWLRGIVRLEALQIVRSRKRVVCVGDEEMLELIERQFEAHVNEKTVSDMEARAGVLHDCVRALDRRGRRLMLGFYRDSSSCRALGQSLRMREAAVRLALFRVRERLRKCVEEKMAVS